MPDSSVDVVFTKGYNLELRRLLQQNTTKLRSRVSVETGLTGKSYDFFRLGASDLATVTTRHGATVLLEAEHTARRCTPVDKAGALPIDKQDELRTLLKPENKYAMNHVASINRFYDNIIVAAATGNSVAVDASDGVSNVTLASWDSGSHVVASGATGLTFEKVNKVTRLLNEDEVPQEDRTFVISPQGLEDLLAETEVGSSDFSTLQALRTGRMEGEWMGFSWVMSNRLSIDASLDRSCIAFHKNAIGLGIWEDIFTDVDVRKDLNYLRQVYARVSAGAVRIEEAGVVEQLIREA